ncbi:MAG TPA: trypsin-like peptidase domain-containing protein [Candidatus Limnocylindrales bacterium]|nr:trypsin-like peptidase domain-containing protein [Candidatus Limnocylindrales bacterium]
MNRLFRASVEQLALYAVIGAAVVLMGLNVPRALTLLQAPAPAPTATPIPPTPPPAAVLLQDELDRDLQGVVILVVEAGSPTTVRVGTAFAIDARGDLLTSATLTSGATAMRVIDASGGSHPVALVGTDPALDLAEVRTSLAGVPLPTGDPATLQVNDPLALLASPKDAGLPPSTPVVITALGAQAAGPQGPVAGLLRLAGDVHPAASGAPVAGPGGTVMGIIVLASDSETLSGFALPISAAAPDLSAWASRPAGALPLAAVPSSLVLRGLDENAAGGPAAGATPSGGAVSVASVQPVRATQAAPAVITIRGAGFAAGPALRVRFLPSGGGSGAFDGIRIAVTDPTTLTVTVPAGMRVQDYTVEVRNGDGRVADAHPSFTVIP